MNIDIPTHRGDCPKYQAVRLLADRGIEDREIGDLFCIATDAVSRRLFDEYEQGSLDCTRFETIEPAAWESEINRLRDENLIVNDDCTLAVVRIGPPPVPPRDGMDHGSPAAAP